MHEAQYLSSPGPLDIVDEPSPLANASEFAKENDLSTEETVKLIMKLAIMAKMEIVAIIIIFFFIFQFY